MNYPNMVPEILEAIHLMYEDVTDVEVDCLLCLSRLRGNLTLGANFANEAEKVLENNNRCPICGSELKNSYHTEIHYEVDDNYPEHIVETYCPNCDILNSCAEENE